MPTATDHPSMQDIADVLSPYAVGHDERLGTFLAISVGRVLLKAAKNRQNWRTLAPEEKLRHIADWLRAALINNEPWIENIDSRGRPKKLMKFGSLEQITQEADKAMLKAARRLSTINLVEGDEELFAELEDGFHIVRLLTPAALDRESAEMQHCIGNGGYDENLESGDYFYLSLRDKGGKAHATLEVHEGAVVQLQGKQNTLPIREYIDRLIPFIRKSKYEVSLPAYQIGYAVDIHGEWHDIHSLPRDLEVRGNLDLSDTKIAILPEKLTVGGNLSLCHSRITFLPEMLTVGGDLDLGYTSINVIPDSLKLGGSLTLKNTIIHALPEGLEIKGSLDLGDARISVLPEGLKVCGFLTLRGSTITALPRRLRVDGDLDLSRTDIDRLPDRLKVGGNLRLKNSKIKVLPKGLEVGLGLFLDDTRISVLPEDLWVGGPISLKNTDVKVLPKDLEVRGYLDLNGTGISAIPDSMANAQLVHTDDGWISAGQFRELHSRTKLFGFPTPH